ncbi:hypothetical protein PFDG_05262 [Plasmodium falciparum Dd2]|uniref:Uncharacterized protein n=1 Tax=Plasmodium falciparum (isolate Dd2) TaxID=57267 RepID=A0A0L7MA25_PLAF4|nr:hypothetical protein PFDG_05262 [Plasmodium falciparum Dd2]
MGNDTWRTPYAFVVYSKSLEDMQGNNIESEQNEILTKYSRWASDTHVHYEFKRTSENLNRCFYGSKFKCSSI